MCPENLGTHLFNAIGLLLVLQLCAQELTVEASDVSNADLLWTLCLASTCVGTVTEAELIHLCNHSLCTTCALDLTLRQLCQRRYTGKLQHKHHNLRKPQHPSTRLHQPSESE